MSKGNILKILMILVFSFVFLASVATALDDFMSLEMRVIYDNKTMEDGNITVTIWNDATATGAGNLVYNSTGDFNGAVSGGYAHLLLGNGSQSLSLVYNMIYFMDIEVNTTDLDFVDKDGNSHERQMFQASVGDVNESIGGFNVTGKVLIENELNVTGNATFDGWTLVVDADNNKVGIGTDSPSDELNVVGDVNITGNITMLGNISANVIDVTGNLTTQVIKGRGDNIVIGDGIDSHSLTADDDLFIAGKLEVDGTSFLDGSLIMNNLIRLNDDKDLEFGTGSDVKIQYDTAQTPDSFWLGLSADSNGFIISEVGDAGFDFAHSLQTNPTIFIHSSTQSVIEWGSLSHDTERFILDSGTNTTQVASVLEVNQELNAQANFTMGDTNNYLLFERSINGTHIVFDSPQDLEFYFTGDNVSFANNISADSLFLSGELNVQSINLDGTDLDMGSGNITMTGNISANVIDVTGNLTTQVIKGRGDNIVIGDGIDSHSLTADDDLFIAGKLEVDGTVYFDGAVNYYLESLHKDEIQAVFGTGGDSIIQWDTTQTPHSFLFGLGSDSNGLIIAQKGDEDFDFAHPLQNNPTLFIQSATQSIIEWGSLSHDTNQFQIDSGTNITEIVSETYFNQNVTVSADLIIGDEVSEDELATWEVNGTHIVFDSPQDFEFYFGGANVTFENNITAVTIMGTVFYADGNEGITAVLNTSSESCNMTFTAGIMTSYVGCAS